MSSLAFDESNPATRGVIEREALRYQAIAQAIGDSSSANPPRQLQGECAREFRVRLLTDLKRHGRFKNSNFSVISRDPAAFNQIAEMVYADAEQKAFGPNPGQLRGVTTVEPSGHKVTRYFGDPALAWAPFGAGVAKFGRINRNLR